ncbi:MAG: hypothetical protein ACOYD1_07605 [Candidatus Nanopelagicales bacterium]
MDQKTRAALLSDIREKRGLTRENVVDEATPEEHPLHGEFTWDDQEAGHKYRLHEAGRLIRSVKIPYERADGSLAKVRAYYAERVPQVPVRSYTPVEEIIEDPLRRKMMEDQMRRDWLTFKARYDHIQEFANLILGFMKEAS